MKKLLTLTLISFALMPVHASFEYAEYLAKLSSKPNMGQPLFKYQDCNQEVQAWLEQVDQMLDPQVVGNYDASFFLSLADDGSISGIELEELRATDAEAFKSFVARLLAYNFPKPPTAIQDQIFSLDARTLYLDRKFISPIKESLLEDTQILPLTVNADQLELDLLEPSYIDHPAIGEELVFANEQGVIINAKIIDLHKKSFLLRAYQCKFKDDTYHLDLVFNVERPKKNSHTLKAVLDSGIASASLAGIGGAISSNGILPGAYAALGIIGATMEEAEKQKSYNLVRGDKITLTSFQDL